MQNLIENTLTSYRFIKSSPLLFLVEVLFIFMSHASQAQNGIFQGTVIDEESREVIPFVVVRLQGTKLGVATDLDGKYKLENIPPSVYNIIFSSMGYAEKVVHEVSISGTKPTVLNIELIPIKVELKEAEVGVSRFERMEEAPLSKVNIRAAEIMRNPGGNRDISKVIQSFPGVASSVSFRNDLIIRGGAPNENRFYLDGIEVPNINHFATQGSSGGPVGLINVNFVNDVDFYSGAFPASRGNTLSSVLEFRQKNGNPDRLASTLMAGSSDFGLTMDGPITKNGDFIFSVRRSYLQLLFSALKLPFLPTYTDAQFKFNYRFNKNNSITVIGLGALDKFRLNKKVNNGETDLEVIERNNYILGYLPVNEQWNYTVGVKYSHFNKRGLHQIILSRNTLNNTARKFEDNDDTDPSKKLLNYNSRETENKLRLESTTKYGAYKFSCGFQYEYVEYTNSTFTRMYLPSGIATIDYSSSLPLQKGGGYVQVSRIFLADRLMLSSGIRSDINDYSSKMNDPLDQLSPRFSVSYQFIEKWFLNANLGRYFQLPPYTSLGYRDSSNVLVNRRNNLKYISSAHLVLGIEHLRSSNTKISLEGFYKRYRNYPLLIDEQISLANLGSDFGVIGDEPVNSNSTGRSYGAELLIQQSIMNGYYGIAAYTYVRSEFTNGGSDYVPSSWDNRHILSLTGGKQLRRNWEIGVKFRYFSGAPFTPFDQQASARKDVWDITRTGVPNYNAINTQRLPASHQLDIRIDKKYFLRKTVLNIYLDIQNIYNNKTLLAPYLTVVTDQNGAAVEDPNNSGSYLLKELKNESGTILPSIGFMWEF